MKMNGITNKDEGKKKIEKEKWQITGKSRI